jgi:hypothetical protein
MEFPPAEAEPEQKLTNLLWRNFRGQRTQLCSFANKPFSKQNHRAIAPDPRSGRHAGAGGGAKKRAAEGMPAFNSVRLAISRTGS